jgi:uncharacterized protein (DUF2141 family)
MARSVSRARPAAVEPLEDRQLLSLTIDLRVSGASNPKATTVSNVGQTLTIEEWATITGSTTATSSNDQVWDSYGSVISTKSKSTSIDGNLSAATVTQYAYNQQDGKVQDLNGDGNLDVGSNSPSDVEDYVFVRSPNMPGTFSGDSVSYELATFTYTVTSLAQGGSTSINFVLPTAAPGGGYSAVWYQDGAGFNSSSDPTGYQVGAPIVISDPSIVPAVGSISGTVSKSVSGSTSAFSGVSVYLDLGDTGSYSSSDPTAVTSSSGAYSFSNLAQGPYYVREVVPSGYTQTSPSSSPTLINIAGNDSYTVNFTDTAVVAKTGSISGTVYKAASGAATTGFSGVTVYLDNNNDGVFDTGDSSVTTSSTGAFSFSGLTANTYHLREVVPTGYKQTSPTTSPTNVVLSAGGVVTGQNFTDTSTTIVNNASISGTVYKGSTSTGFAGVTVYLDNNNNGVLDTGDTSVTTSSTGTFSFTGLAPTTYHLREVVPTGYTQTSPTSSPTNITLTAGQASTGDNFIDTASVTATGSISGSVYNDKNSNGKLDSGEAGIANIELYLDLKKDGKIDAGDPIFTTNASGAFTVTGLAAGTYRLREVVLSGYTLVSPSAGYYDVTVANGAAVKGENFFDHITTSNGIMLSGNVFSDLNSNGTRDMNEPGLSNWVVYLDLNDDGKFESNENTKTTDSYGNFSFVSLKAGTYYVRLVAQGGYSQTSPTSGYFKVTLVAGTPTTVAFAEHQTGATTSTGTGSSNTSGGTTTTTGGVTTVSTSSSSITVSGNVFADTNGNGVQDSGEKGLSGWVVYVDLNDSGKYVSGDNTKTTDANGNFSFVSLKPGTYIIRVIPQTGYTESAPASGFFTVSIATGDVVTGLSFGEEA